MKDRLFEFRKHQSVERLIVPITESPAPFPSSTLFNKTNLCGIGLKDIFIPIYGWSFGMVFGHVFAMCYYFKILNPIISFIPISVMYLFTILKRPSKKLLNYKSMLKNSLPVMKDSHIPIFRYPRLSFFKIRPIWRKVIIAMSHEPKPMLSAYMPVLFFKDVSTPFYSTDCTFHFLKDIIA